MDVCALLLLCSAAVLGLPAAAETGGTDYYQTLNVEPTATESQIKKAFRRLAVKFHPDKSKSADAEKTFREMTEAYKVLSNKEKRRVYDVLGHKAFLNNRVFVDAEHETNTHFTFSSYTYDFGESLYEREFQWFGHEWEEEEEEEFDPYEYYSSEGPTISF